jgi:hypothetical protein
VCKIGKQKGECCAPAWWPHYPRPPPVWPGSAAQSWSPHTCSSYKWICSFVQISYSGLLTCCIARTHSVPPAVLRIRTGLKLQMQILAFYVNTDLDPRFLWPIFVVVYYRMQFIWPLASMKDNHATGEAFSPQMRTSSTSKHEIYSLCSIFVGHFCPLGSGSSLPKSMRNRIPDSATGINV